MSFFDAGCLSTEDRKEIVEIISDIKKQEKEQIERATRGAKSDYTPPNVNMSKLNKPTKFSSLNKSWSNPRPNIPNR